MADKMRIYDDVKDLVEEEIDKILKKDALDEKCLNYLDKLVDIAKDVDTITAMHEYGAEANEDMRGYSGRMYPPMYNTGRSYGYNNRRYSGETQNWNGDGRSNGYRNGYSRGGNDMVARLNQMLDEASTEHEREAIRMALQQM